MGDISGFLLSVQPQLFEYQRMNQLNMIKQKRQNLRGAQLLRAQERNTRAHTHTHSTAHTQS